MNESEFNLKFQLETSQKLQWALTFEPENTALPQIPGTPTKNPVISITGDEIGTPMSLPIIPITPSFSQQSMPSGSPIIDAMKISR
jgi:hypothetical protein